jgi:hypothetical protein
MRQKKLDALFACVQLYCKHSLGARIKLLFIYYILKINNIFKPQKKTWTRSDLNQYLWHAKPIFYQIKLRILNLYQILLFACTGT